MDEEAGRVEVVVPDEQLSLAIGRRGQNVRLASQLTGWQIDIITEAQDSERRQREFAERTALFQEALDVDEVIAQLLVTEGFASVEDVAYVEASEIASIEGFDEDTAEEIQARARDYLEKEAAEYDARRRELGVEDAVLEVEGVTLPMAVALGEHDVKTLEDLAGLVPDDIRGYYESKDGERVREPGILDDFSLSPEDAEALIMRARVAAGWIEPEAEIEEALDEEDDVLAHADEAAEEALEEAEEAAEIEEGLEEEDDVLARADIAADEAQEDED
jgi:N utilization substance protein A